MEGVNGLFAEQDTCSLAFEASAMGSFRRGAARFLLVEKGEAINQAELVRMMGAVARAELFLGGAPGKERAT